MNWIQCIDVIYEIYKKQPPNIEKLQKYGLLAIKIGQVYALRIDFLSSETCAELAKLYRSTLPVTPTYFHDILKMYVPPEIRDRIKTIEEKPLASASVGQVHEARLKTGDKVVIKFIKADAKENFKRDIRSIRGFLKVLLCFYPRLRKVADPEGILDHIEEYTLLELDLENEVKGHHILQDLYTEHQDRFDFASLTFPRLYEEYSNEMVLFSELIPGRTFDELLERKELNYDRLLELFTIHGNYLFGIGTFHGDIHPGNIMLHENKIYFIDTGAISHVPEKFRQGLFWFLEALSRYDYDACAEHLQTMSEKRLSDNKFKKFKRSFLTLYSEFKGKTVSEVSLTKQMMETIKTAVHAGMDFEEGMFPIIKSLMYLDGMVLECNPDAVLLEDMREPLHALKSHMQR